MSLLFLHHVSCPLFHPIFFSPFSLFFFKCKLSLLKVTVLSTFVSIETTLNRLSCSYSQVTVLKPGQEQDKAFTLMEPNYRKSADSKGSDLILGGSLSTRRIYLTCLEEHMRWKIPNEHSLSMYTDCKCLLFSQDHLMFVIKSVSTLSNIQILSRVLDINLTLFYR